MKLVKVEYEVLEPVLDFHTAKDNPVLVHPEDNWESLAPVGADNRRNLCAHDECGNGDIDAVLADCDVVIDRVYHTQACQQAMMETFRTYCEIDTYGRLHVSARRRSCSTLAESWRTHCISRKARCASPSRASAAALAPSRRGCCEIYRGVRDPADRKPSELLLLHPRGEPSLRATRATRCRCTVKSGRHERRHHHGHRSAHAVQRRRVRRTRLPTTIGLSGHKTPAHLQPCEGESALAGTPSTPIPTVGGRVSRLRCHPGPVCRGECRQRARRHVAHGPRRPAP